MINIPKVMSMVESDLFTNALRATEKIPKAPIPKAEYKIAAVYLVMNCDCSITSNPLNKTIISPYPNNTTAGRRTANAVKSIKTKT